MILKKRLAREIVAQLYSQKDATEAEEHFTKVRQKQETPDDIPEVLSGKLLDMLFERGIATSRSEARRLIIQGAVDVDGQKVTDPQQQILKGSIIRVGKKRLDFIKSI